MEGRKLALVIGNSEYEDGNLSRLVTPGADVNGLAEILRSPDIGEFEEVTALVNQPAAAVRRAISGFFVNRNRDDLLVLYFSGHGIRDDRGQLFLAVKDTETQLLRGTAIPATFITEEMDNSRSRRQVLILDCCHSGAFSQGMKGAPGSSVGTAAAFQGTGFGRVVLTATDSTQYAWEGDQVIGQAENSVFTQYLIQGLRTGSADTDGDGKITLDELYDYVYEHVVNETPRQTPSKWSYGQQGDILIAHNPHPVVRPAPLPLDLQQTIDDPRPWVREGAVRELDRLLRASTPGLALAAREALKRLAEDDSRRVSSAAAECLAGLLADEIPIKKPAENAPAAVPTRVKPSSQDNAPPSGRLEAERQNDAGRSPEPAAASQPKTGSLAAEAGIPAAAGAAQSGWAAPGEMAQPQVVEAAGRDSARPGQLSGWQLFDAMLGSLASLFRGSLRRKVLLVGAAWGFGGLITGLIGWSAQSDAGRWIIGLVIGGAIAGLALGLALLEMEPSIQRKWILLITAAWAFCLLLSGTVADLLGRAVGGISAGALYGVIGWNAAEILGKATGRLFGNLIVGGLCALPVGLALLNGKNPIRSNTMRSIITVWAILWTVSVTSLTFLLDYTELQSKPLLIFVLGALWLVTGALGSRHTFRQIIDDRRQTT